MKMNAYKTKTKDELIEELEGLHEELAILQKADAERQHAMDALRDREEEHRILLDESSDPIFAIYPDGRYRYVNRIFAKSFDKEPREIIGQKVWDVFSKKEEADNCFAIVEWTLKNGEKKEIEVCVPGPDGDRFFITTAKPIFGEKCGVNSVICISKEITERKIMEDRLAHMAQHDALTNLPNRALLYDLLHQAIVQAKRHKSQLALMFLDLDKFKMVNDTLGHHVGDLLLKAVAKRIQKCMRESDTVARIGGDEFVVLLPIIEKEHDAQVVAEKIRSSLNKPFDFPGYQSLNISSSIGIALYPSHGIDVIQLSKNADDAMYQAKTKGRNLVQLFQPS